MKTAAKTETDTRSGYPSTLNDQQQTALEELKIELKKTDYGDKLQDHPDLDGFLLRVFRATMKDKHHTRVFEVKPALERVLIILKGKESHNIHLDNKPSKFDEYRKIYPKYCYKDSKSNKLLWFSRIGAFASHGKFKRLQEEEWTQCVGYEMEHVEKTLRDFSAKQGVENRGYISIADLKGLSLSAISQKKAVVFLGNVAGEMYPEVLDRVIAVNAPWIVSKIFSLIKPLLDADTARKIEIYSSIPPFFKEMFDTELLPKEMGGKNDTVIPYPIDSKKFDEKLITHENDCEIFEH